MTAPPPISALRAACQASIEATDQSEGVGIDLVEIEPLRQLLVSGGRPFLDAAWTAREQRDANRQAEGMAGKWAAKEAVMKALGHGIGDLDPRDVEIVTTPHGAPQVELHRSARAIAKRQRITTWHLSVTHEGGWAASDRHCVVAATSQAGGPCERKEEPWLTRSGLRRPRSGPTTKRSPTSMTARSKQRSGRG